MSRGAQKMRDFYDMKKGAPIYQEEFGFYSLEKWKADGFLNDTDDLNKLFGYDEPWKAYFG